MEKYIDIYNEKEKCNIKAKIFENENNKKSNSIFIFCHGFCSSKESKSVTTVAHKLLKYGVSSIAFDFPGHGDSIQGADKLRVRVCISYLDSVVNYVKEIYGEDTKISFFAISFGSYILLNKLIGDKFYYNNIVLRSPAFNMKDILIDALIKEPFEKYKKNGKAKAGFGGKIEVTYSFYEDLIKNDLYTNYNEKRKILVIQGALDDTAPIEDTYIFIKNRPDIELIKVENVKHHMEPKELDLVSDIMIEKLNLIKLT